MARLTWLSSVFRVAAPVVAAIIGLVVTVVLGVVASANLLEEFHRTGAVTQFHLARRNAAAARSA